MQLTLLRQTLKKKCFTVRNPYKNVLLLETHIKMFYC